MNGSRQVANYC
jgi:hypothetical protein